MTNLWHSISSIGERPHEEAWWTRYRMLTNRLAFFLMLLGTIGLANYTQYYDSETSSWSIPRLIQGLITPILSVFALWLSYRYRFKAARFIINLAIPLSYIGLYLAAPFRPESDLTWFPLVAAVQPVFVHMSLHPKHDRGLFWLGIVASVIIWALGDWALLQSADSQDTLVIAFRENLSHHKWSTFFFLLLIHLGLWYLNRHNQHIENKLQEEKTTAQKQAGLLEAQNQELQETRNQIADQLDELKQQQEEIQQINENLEFMVQQRTHELEKQNQQLAEYAFINGHLLRAPLCRVQGLVYLMELSDKVTKEDPLYQHLRESVDEFSGVVAHIDRLVEEGAHFDRYDFVQELDQASDSTKVINQINSLNESVE